MTKREMFNAILAIDAVSANEEMVEFLNHQIELLDSRKGSSKPSKTQTENIGIKDTIYEVLSENGGRMRVKDMLEDARLSEYSSSKITALLRQMLPEVGDGRVVKTIDKKVSYFEVA